MVFWKTGVNVTWRRIHADDDARVLNGAIWVQKLAPNDSGLRVGFRVLLELVEPSAAWDGVVVQKDQKVASLRRCRARVHRVTKPECRVEVHDGDPVAIALENVGRGVVRAVVDHDD